jgi:hypothetical protein
MTHEAAGRRRLRDATARRLTLSGGTARARACSVRQAGARRLIKAARLARLGASCSSYVTSGTRRDRKPICLRGRESARRTELHGPV